MPCPVVMMQGHMEAQARNQRAKRFEAHLQGGGPSSGPTKSGMGWQLPSTSLQVSHMIAHSTHKRTGCVSALCLGLASAWDLLGARWDPPLEGHLLDLLSPLPAVRLRSL